MRSLKSNYFTLSLSHSPLEDFTKRAFPDLLLLSEEHVWVHFRIATQHLNNTTTCVCAHICVKCTCEIQNKERYLKREGGNFITYANRPTSTLHLHKQSPCSLGWPGSQAIHRQRYILYTRGHAHHQQ